MTINSAVKASCAHEHDLVKLKYWYQFDTAQVGSKTSVSKESRVIKFSLRLDMTPVLRNLSS